MGNLLPGRVFKALINRFQKPEKLTSVSLIAVNMHFDALHRRAREGDAQAQFDLSQHYFNDGPPQDIKRALDFLDRSAAGGHTGAQMALAKVYARGVHRPADPAKVLLFYKQASDGGDAAATYALGSVFELGRFGAPQDYATARHLFAHAAQAGHGPSAYRLGIFYLNGYSVRQSLSNAALWFAIAVRLHHAAAKPAVARLRNRLTEAEKQRVSAYLSRWDQLRA